jgi:hypothetical protein
MCRQVIIDYYFETGKYPTEDNIEHLMPCNICDNCKTEHKQEMKDISHVSQEIVKIITKNYKNNGFNVGMGKTLKMINQSQNINKSGIWIRDVIDVLIDKNILIRYKAGFGFAIGIGKINIKNKLPIMARIYDVKPETIVKIKYNDLDKLKGIRDKLSTKYQGPKGDKAIFINERVLLNIYNSKPKSMADLWNVDGISDDFIMRYGPEFMTEYLKKPKKRNKNPRQMVLKLYKEGKQMHEIADNMEVKIRTIEQHMLYIFETNDDIDIDLDYFDLTEEKENEIQKAILKIGTTNGLKKIKDIVNDSITYSQIKLCLLVMKFNNTI